jgi:hypothetical protein
LFGVERHRDELPQCVADKHIAKLRDVKGTLETEAREASKAAPEPKAQLNMTDPESRITHNSGKECVQAYARAATDSKDQVIIAQSVSSCPDDLQQLKPMVKQLRDDAGR